MTRAWWFAAAAAALALAVLSRAVAAGDALVVYCAHDVHLAFLPVDPRWAAYRADPRFLDFVGRCGFRSEATR